MNKILWLVLAALLVCIGAPALAQSMDPVKPGELQLAQKVLTLQRWAEAVDQQLDDAASSTNGILAEGTVYIGNASNLATSQTLSGAASVTTGGVVTLLGNIPVARITNAAGSVGASIGGNIPVAAITNAAGSVGAFIGGNIPVGALTNALAANLGTVNVTNSLVSGTNVNTIIVRNGLITSWTTGN